MVKRRSCILRYSDIHHLAGCNAHTHTKQFKHNGTFFRSIFLFHYTKTNKKRAKPKISTIACKSFPIKLLEMPDIT
ncbi:hypothetical protein C2G38_772723 [Gigaspora rosea]|uniref:Uncharacterized protein n=1 Tax=Gigaspora rosea TaxID=44941 RepID=A0A397U3B6_9GLOM|nr:hypothetical protein C2G38_772723 [Gigaspora rosea]